MNPLLTDGRIVVRPPALNDVAALYSAAKESTDEVGRWLPWCRPDYAEAETRRFVSACIDAWARLDQFPFVVEDRTSGQLLGGVGLSNIDAVNRLGGLGYWVRTSRTGQGVASAAARLVCKFAFSGAALTRVEIAVHPENIGSRRVAEKLGAKLEGVARNRIVMQGKAQDAVVYSVIPNDLAG